ncbi:MAG: lycopene cyclase family protein [Saprospiraceae bacterium]|nr:lycopene cyclase family protein [Saprospiraceae bacterium]
MNFDFIILGGGAAGLSLAYRMANDDFFSNKKIALIEKGEKNKNDRTWCFWEKDEGLFESIIDKRWDNLHFYSKTLDKVLDIYPYQYKMISGLSFYNYTLPKVKEANNIIYVKGSVESIQEVHQGVEVKTTAGTYSAPIVFKSFPSVNEIDKKEHLYVDQHFKGYMIALEEDRFDPNEATFMDFRIDQKGDARFFYVLPQTARKALVEVAIFSNNILKQEEYDSILQDYINTFLGIEQYSIDEEEFGVIPMTTYPFMEANTDKVFHIGTGGGVVKPSSGYAFKRIQEHSDQIITCLKEGKSLKESYKGLNGRFLLYDKVMLHAMLHNGVSGEEIFTKLFKKKKASSIFKFLNQKTHFLEELSIFTAPPMWPFTKSFFTLISK